MENNKNNNSSTEESANQGVIDYLMLSDSEKQLFVSNLAGIVVLAIGALLSVFLTKFSEYVPYLMFVAVVFNLTVQYLVNRAKTELKELKIENDPKVQQLFAIMKSFRVLVTVIIGVKAVAALI